MNAPPALLHRKPTRGAVRPRTPVARGGGMWFGGGRKGAAGDKRFGEYTLTVWEACNPLKSHKTAKDMFGKAWTKTAKIWKSLRKCVGGRPHSAAFARPPRRRRYSIAAAFRMHTIVACAGTEPGCESGAAGRSDSARFPRRAGSGRNRRHLRPQEREKGS